MKTNSIVLADIASHNTNGKSVGHYFYLAHNYVEMFPECKIAGGPIYEQAFGEKQLIKLPYDTMHDESALMKKWHQWRNFRYLISECEDDVLVFQQAALATLMVFLAITPSIRKKAFFITYDDDAVRSTFKRFVYRFAKRKLKGIICPNNKVASQYELPSCIVPDYIYVGGNDVQKSQQFEKIYDFCLVGRLAPEKGALGIIQKYRDSHYKVLIAGNPQDPELKETLLKAANGAENIELHLGYVEPDDYYRYIHSSKYTLLNYSGEYSIRSSGVVFDTLFAGVPVIGRRCAALNFIEENECGILYDDLATFNADEVLTDSKYEYFIRNIYKYRDTHRLYISKLINFFHS